MPGPVTSAASAGSHRLIRDYDAVCVTNPDQMAELAPLAEKAGEAAATDMTSRISSATAGSEAPAENLDFDASRNSETMRLLDALSARGARNTDDIASRCGLSLARVRAGLGMLELDGRVTETERGWKRAPATS